MKKHLIAAAVAAAVAVPAMAQNVQIGGVLDAGLDRVTNTDAAGTANTRVASGQLATSNFRIRGSEDLGGGMKANFNLESTLGMDVGAAGAGNTAAGVAGSNTKLFDRNATIGLQVNTFTVDVGRQNTLFTDSLAAVDPLKFAFAATGNLNVAYSALNASPNTVAYGATSHVGAPTGTAPTAISLLRMDNSVKAQYDAGVAKVGFFYSAGEVSGQMGQRRGTGFNISGKFADATIVAAYQTINAVGTGPTDSITGTMYGVSMPIGPFQVRASYAQQKWDALTNVGTTKVVGVGASYDLAAGRNINLAYYDGSNNANLTAAAPDANSLAGAVNNGTQKTWAAVYTHDLSKRTSLYGAFQMRDYGGGQSVFRGNGLRDSDSLMATGVRHTF